MYIYVLICVLIYYFKKLLSNMKGMCTDICMYVCMCVNTARAAFVSFAAHCVDLVDEYDRRR